MLLPLRQIVSNKLPLHAITPATAVIAGVLLDVFVADAVVAEREKLQQAG